MVPTSQSATSFPSATGDFRWVTNERRIQTSNKMPPIPRESGMLEGDVMMLERVFSVRFYPVTFTRIKDEP